MNRLTLLICLAGIILLILAILFVLEKTGVINLYQKNNVVLTDNPAAKTTSDAPSAQENFTGGEEREPGNTLQENAGSGDVLDQNGFIDAGVDTSNPTTSATGEISVFTPEPNTIISDGAVLSGQSSLSKITYRLIDSASGVIASGELSVVEGKFSGIIKFTTAASKGRVDIFGTKDDLSEFSNIEIPVRFAQ